MSEYRKAAIAFAKTMRCNCDLDNWEPEPSTGHSRVCRIHHAAMTRTDWRKPSEEATRDANG